MRQIVKDEFCRAVRVPMVAFSAEAPDSPKLIIVLLDPEIEWTAGDDLRAQLAEWTKKRGTLPRLYPGALVWCIKKQGGNV